MLRALQRNFWERWAEFSCRRSRSLLIAVGVLTLFFAGAITRLKVVTQVRDLQRQEAVNLGDTIEDRFQEARYIILLFEAQGDTSLMEPALLKEQLKVILAVQERFPVTSLTLVSGIDSALRRLKNISVMDVTNFNPIGEALFAAASPATVVDFERISRHMVSHPEAIDYYEKVGMLLSRSLGGHPDAKGGYGVPYIKAAKGYLQLDASATGEKQRDTIVSIRKLVQGLPTPGLNVYLYADDLITADVDAASQRNTLFMGLVLIAVDAFLLWMIFRNRNELLVALVLLVTSCIWTFGLASLLGIRVSQVHMMALPILLGTGIDDVVIFGSRFLEERKKMPAADSVRATFKGMGTAIFLTTFTTSVSFLCSATTSATAILTFNLLVAIAMMMLFALTITLEGALRMEFDRRGWFVQTPKTRHRFWEAAERALSFFPRLAVKALPHGSRLLPYALLLGILGLALGLRIETQFDRDTFLRPNMPTYRADQVEESYFGRNNVGYILIEGPVEDVRVIDKLRRLEATMGRYPLVERIFGRADTRSITDLLDKQKIRLTPETPVGEVFAKIRNDTRTANPILDRSFQKDFTHAVAYSGDKADALLLKFFARSDDVKAIQALGKDLAREIENLGFEDIPGIRVRIGGGDISLDFEQEYYFRNMMWGFVLSLALVFLTLFVFWRHWGRSFLSLVPILMALAVTVGTMGLFGIRLNSVNLTIAALVVGLGVDYPIHLIECFLERRSLNPQESPENAMTEILSSMSPDIFGSALTTMFGFGAAALMTLPVARSFGLLIALAVFVAYLSSIFLLPGLLIRWSRLASAH